MIFELLGRDALLAAVERVKKLVEPQDEIYFKELRKFLRKIRYAPALLAGPEWTPLQRADRFWTLSNTSARFMPV